MPTLEVSGTLDQLTDKLGRIKATVDHRVAEGYPILQPDEAWYYSTAKDQRVCPICQALDNAIIQGDMVKTQFTHLMLVNSALITPEIHMRCRCYLDWTNKYEVVLARFYEELVNTIV